ncbi:hypothetical protein HZH68_005054 [Vespula germanica]|uniref:Uncharacterized protein n=1 Tax=Vespula germanica TaxID=30212 RepID=A0A834KFI0_VESGE|nr:hypothetical protein HZH68_005054 [Vespula germanica]
MIRKIKKKNLKRREGSVLKIGKDRIKFEWYVLEKGGGNGGSSKKRGWIGNSTIRGYPALLCLSLRRQSALTRPPMLYSLETPR